MVYTVRDLLAQHRKGLSKIAIVDPHGTISYRELKNQAMILAAALMERGVKKGDRVATFLPRSAQAVVAMFAAWYAGGVVVILNEVLKTRQVNYILQHSESLLLVTNSRMLRSAGELAFDRGNILVLDDDQRPSAQLLPAPLIGSDMAMIIYTSGSTGMPKGVMLSHENLVSGAQIVSDYLGLTGRDVLISLLPFSFDYGLNQLLTSLCVGATLVIQRSVLPGDICNALREHRVTGMAGVPMLWQQLAHPRSPFIKAHFPRLRYITNTGGRMPETLTKLFRKCHPRVQIFLMYGLTEAFRSTYLPPEEVDRRPTSIGKAIPNVEILVVDEKGRPCVPGEVGELIHCGANTSLGYWKDPQSTAEKFRPHPFSRNRGGYGEVVVYSGDYVKTDHEGFLYFVGRKDQMMKSHGMRVSPQEIEDCLFASSLVAHAVAFSVERDGVESEIVAAVVPNDPPTFRAELLHKFCKQEMPDYLRPRVIWPCETFPQTSSGKPDGVRIKEMYIEHVLKGHTRQS